MCRTRHQSVGLYETKQQLTAARSRHSCRLEVAFFLRTMLSTTHAFTTLAQLSERNLLEALQPQR